MTASLAAKTHRLHQVSLGLIGVNCEFADAAVSIVAVAAVPAAAASREVFARYETQRLRQNNHLDRVSLASSLKIRSCIEEKFFDLVFVNAFLTR